MLKRAVGRLVGRGEANLAFDVPNARKTGTERDGRDDVRRGGRGRRPHRYDRLRADAPPAEDTTAWRYGRTLLTTADGLDDPAPASEPIPLRPAAG